MMVLLTAVKNFRQYNNKNSTGNALSIVDLSAVPSIEHWSPSARLIDKGMEIERYHAAFPALGTPVSSGYMESFNLAPVGRTTPEPYQLPFDAHVNGVDAVTSVSGQAGVDAGFSVSNKSSQHNAHYRVFKHRQAKAAFQQQSHVNDNHRSHSYHKRSTKQSLPKQRKVFRDKQLDQNVQVRQKRFLGAHKNLEWKPWKHLDPVERDGDECLSTLTANNTSSPAKCEWISDEMLSLFLSKDNSSETLSADHFRTLWDEKEGVDAAGRLWKADSLAECSLVAENDSGFSFGNVGIEDDKDKVDVDYDLLERSMASLKFCEDLPSTCQGSKLLPMFDENPISSMILNTSAVEATADRTEPALACQHGLEAYEIVLDCESSTKPKLYDHRLLRETDSILNFDWCRYQPPSWIDGNHSGSEKTDNLTSRYSCNCEFCRSRAWVRTCAICGTPL